MTLRAPLWLIAVPLTLSLAACSGNDGGDSDPTPTATTPIIRGQIMAIDRAVTAWRQASSIDEAHASAEAAANLVVGPRGPGYGDRDGNGVIDGETEAGLLPGLEGSPTGLANALDDNECIVADVLGGAWEVPADRWNTMLAAIDEWRPRNNTMPTLPSHPMRVVGWATFTLASDSLEDAHEYAGHARLHVDISLAALDC